MRVVLLVTSGARSEAADLAARLVRSGQAAGHQFDVFLAGDGVVHADAMESLSGTGARVVLCAADAGIRGLDRPGRPGRGSFSDLSAMAREADHCLVL